jgi:hypothetical protein
MFDNYHVQEAIFGLFGYIHSSPAGAIATSLLTTAWYISFTLSRRAINFIEPNGAIEHGINGHLVSVYIVK